MKLSISLPHTQPLRCKTMFSFTLMRLFRNCWDRTAICSTFAVGTCGQTGYPTAIRNTENTKRKQYHVAYHFYQYLELGNCILRNNTRRRKFRNRHQSGSPKNNFQENQKSMPGRKRHGLSRRYCQNLQIRRLQSQKNLNNLTDCN